VANGCTALDWTDCSHDSHFALYTPRTDKASDLFAAKWQFIYKMLNYRRETALQGALYFSPKVENWNWETIF